MKIGGLVMGGLLGWFALGLAVDCDGAEASPSTTSVIDAPSKPGRNYLLNPQFSDVDPVSGEPTNWSLSAHATTGSYQMSARDGVLSLRRVGPEVWGLVSQNVPTAGLEGKTVEFSVDVKASLTNEYGDEPFDKTDLQVVLRGVRAGSNALFGKADLVIEQGPGMDIGERDWHRRSLRFRVPAANEATHLELIVSMQLTRGGDLWFRDPSLKVVRVKPDPLAD